MLRKNICIFIVLCVCIATISGCKKSESKKIEATVTEEITEVSEEPVEVKAEPIIEKQYSIRNVLTDFYEDRAWVIFNTGKNENNIDTYEYGVIDRNGFIVKPIFDYLKEHSAEMKDFGKMMVSDFKDGISCIYGFTNHYSRNPGMIVFDRDGKVIFSSLDAVDNVNFYYLGHDNGSILAIEHTADFSTNKYVFCEIDKSGKIIERIDYHLNWEGGMTTTGYRASDNFKYYDEGIFAGTAEVAIGSIPFIYNKSTTSTISINGAIMDIANGYAVIEINHNLYSVPTKYLQNIQAWQSINVRDYKILEHTYAERHVGEGLINDKKGVYDYAGNSIALYPENWNVDSVGTFKDGYATVSLKGADGKGYYTLVDRNGNQQFEPKRYDKNLELYQGYTSITIDNVKKAYNPMGGEISQSEYEEISTKLKRCEGDEKSEIYKGINDGEGNTIRSVYFVSNYDELEAKKYSVKDSSSAPQENTEKNYTNISNFSIIGKWKNIGTYTYGQAQKGAIISFNGTNCNLFSPKDTYSFRKNGGYYILDCTSPLGDTVTFTVKLIDKNTIDIFNGSNILELKRVE